MYTHKLPTDDELTALSDWHRGRTKFGLWYVKITCPDVLAHCHTNQQKLTMLLAPNYHRQFHVTVFVGGFWVADKVCDDEMTRQMLDEQVGALDRLGLSPFCLTLSDLHAFDNCVAIRVDDSGQLHSIRHALSAVHGEISPSHYVPHVTLGFYQDTFLKADVLGVLQGIVCRPVSFWVDKLTFGHYQATQGQGRLTDVMVWGLR